MRPIVSLGRKRPEERSNHPDQEEWEEKTHKTGFPQNPEKKEPSEDPDYPASATTISMSKPHGNLRDRPSHITVPGETRILECQGRMQVGFSQELRK